MANSTIIFTPKRRLIAPPAADQLLLGTLLATDDIIALVTSSAIPVTTSATGSILVWDDLGNTRTLLYTSYTGSTFTIDTATGAEDFLLINASVGNAVWITDLDPSGSYTLTVTLEAFDMSEEESVKEVKTMSGIVGKSYYYSTRIYSCNTLKSGSLTEPTAAEYEMFLASVKGGESFTMTNLDESDATMDVQLIGAPSKTRPNHVDVGKFTYSFAVREEV